MADPLDLYRVGDPSIGEMWPNRFSHTRSSGGMGTGIYAFREEWAAKQNLEGPWGNEGLYELENAVENPVQPLSWEATDALVYLSRQLSYIAERYHAGSLDWSKIHERGEVLTVKVYEGLTSGKSVGEGDGKPIEESARKFLFDTPELRDVYGYDSDALVADALAAAKEAADALGSYHEGTVQPINRLLYPRFDGVCPRDDAGGNSGKHGCVVFKERVDKCVGRDTETFEEAEADALNACWTP